MSKSKSKKEVSQLEDGARYFVGLASNLMDAAREKDVPFEAIYRLATEGGKATLNKIVDLAYEDWCAELPKNVERPTNGSVSFTATVVYAIPAMDELKRRFPAHVTPAFAKIAFKPIKVCENVSRETREVEFEYVHLGHDASNDEVLAEIDRRGLRPALPEELLAFDAKYPEEMMKFPIVALGSGTRVGGNSRVACLWRDVRSRRLSLSWGDSGWRGNDRFLAVRKVSSGSVVADRPKSEVGFVATVVYAIPAMDELKRRFPAYVNPAFNSITFKPIKVCETISRETREVEFEYVHLGHDASNDAVLAEIDKRGLRPALPEELLAFDAKYPEEMTKFPIVALGSETRVVGRRRVAYLWDDDSGRRLDLDSVGRGWYGDFRFLAVRKASS